MPEFLPGPIILIVALLVFLAWIFSLLDKSPMHRKPLELKNLFMPHNTLPIFERLDVLQRLKLKLKQSDAGKTYAVGKFQGYGLILEVSSDAP